MPARPWAKGISACFLTIHLVRLLLISTYELGRQPVHVASPAAALRAEGHDVAVADLSVQSFEDLDLDGADGIAISVPMHTAMRLAIDVARQVRSTHPDLPIALYGLYAGVGRERTVDELDASLFAGEYEPALKQWASDLVGRAFSMNVGATSFSAPSREGLPQLGEYARLEWNGEHRLVGSVEASHGCRHRCRHCPIPVLYDGRMRVVGADSVLADIDQLVEAGAQHITFGDPDYLNAPRYSMDLLEAAHARHPDLTFDVTVKVSHILEHRSIWDEAAELGVLFVVSAFESVDDSTLEILDKNHTAADMSEAASLVRDAGIYIRPTWLPFFPWTRPQDLYDIVRFLDDHRLWEATDPVQLSIRLLLPEGSLLEDHPAVRPHLHGYDPAALTWRWGFADPEAELLQKKLDAIAADASDCGEEAISTLRSMRTAIADSARIDIGPMPVADESVPRLTESWFCCAEPTPGQAVSIGLTSR